LISPLLLDQDTGKDRKSEDSGTTGLSGIRKGITAEPHPDGRHSSSRKLGLDDNKLG
jgi:hypothetical protein